MAVAVESASTSGENVWVADSGNSRIEKFKPNGTFVAEYGVNGKENGQFIEPLGIALDETDKYVFVSDAGNKRIQAFEASNGKYFSQLNVDPLKLGLTPAGIATGKLKIVGEARSYLCYVLTVQNSVSCYQISNGKFLEIGKLSFGSTGTGNGQFKEPVAVAVSENGKTNGEGNQIFVTDRGNHRVEVFEPESLGETIKYVGQFGSQGGGEGQFATPGSIAIGPHEGTYASLKGEAFVADSGNSRVQQSSPTGANPYDWSFGSGSQSMAFSAKPGEGLQDLYVVSAASSTEGRIAKWIPRPVEVKPPEPPNPGTSAVTTVEYRVPVFGAGAPYAMGKTEVEKWGQTDFPSEATAIFPADEPMGWPAKDYKRASIVYLDERGRTVNVAKPSGGIETIEYNSFNEVRRTLSAANRAIAVKEGSKSKEVAIALSNESIYNGEGTQLVETLGPEHKITLENGSEVETRSHQSFAYNEKQPSGEAYNLLTKEKSWMQTATSEELAKHEKTLSYDGDEGLGWKLRRPTSETSVVNGHPVTLDTTYDPNTGQATEAFESISPTGPGYAFQFGSFGSGNGQFEQPWGLAIDPNGNTWVADIWHHRVEEFSASGQYINKFGSYGTGNGNLKEPRGVALDSKGNVWVADTGNSRIEEFSPSGSYVAQYGSLGSGNGQFEEPKAIAIDSKDNVWVTDTGNDRVEELSSSGTYLAKFGSYGSGNGQFYEPKGIAVDQSGHIWVADSGNNRVEKFSHSGTYIAQFGTAGSGNGQLSTPKGITIDSRGNIWIADFGNNRVEEFTPSGEYLTKLGAYGSGNGQFNEPQGIDIDPQGGVRVSDTGNNRIEVWSSTAPTPVYLSQFGAVGSGNGQLKEPKGLAVAGNGNVYVADSANNRVEEFSSTGAYLGQFGTSGTGNGQLKGPVALALDAKGDIWVADMANNRVQEFNNKNEYVLKFGAAGSGNGQFKEPKGIAVAANGNVYVADGGNNRIQEFDEHGTYVAQFGTEGTGNGQLKQPRGVAISGNGLVIVADYGNNRVEEFTESGVYSAQFGSSGTGSGQFKEPKALTADVNGDIWVTDSANSRVQEFTLSGSLLSVFGGKGVGNGQFEELWGIGASIGGNIYIADVKNNRIQRWTSIPRPGNEAANNTITIEYSTAANAEYPSCGGHPEWANMPCMTMPAAQPGVSGLPELPVTTVTYNIWDGPETIVEKIGSVTRTKKETFDAAGREETSETTSTVDTPVPVVTDEYSSETGAMIKQRTTVEGKTQAITSVYNKLGQPTSYTDADGNTSKYTYDIDGRVEEVNDGKGSQMYAYDPTTGFLTKLLDIATGTFTATYDVAGKMLTEGYPNGMTAEYSYNPVGQATTLQYEKTTHCTEKCVWFKDAAAFSATDEVMSQSSTLSNETYSYDQAGNLAQTTETPAGGGCVTRLYRYNEENERTSLTTREPNAKGECTTEGGSSEFHTYDVIGRLVDEGVSYDTFGNTTSLPAADAGGSTLKTSYYVDNQVAVQEQGGETISYKYDPAGRTRETVSSGNTASTVVSHYEGPGEALAWTGESSEKWSRNIPGIDGALDAIQANGAAPVLQLHDLQGSIVATASLSETETKLLSTHNVTEFGVPIGTAPRYSWLGATGLATELPSGIATSDGMSYVPQVAQELQTEEADPPGARPNGSYSGAPYITSLSPETVARSGAFGAEAPAARASEEAMLARMACESNPASCDGGSDNGGGAAGDGPSIGAGGGLGDGVVSLPRVCTGPDGEWYLCEEGRGGAVGRGGTQKKSSAGHSEFLAEAWECSLSYSGFWYRGSPLLKGAIECDIRVNNYSLEAVVKYKKEQAVEKEHGSFKEFMGGNRADFYVGFKNFKGRMGHTWSQVCWNALTNRGWASGCTGSLNF